MRHVYSGLISGNKTTSRRFDAFVNNATMRSMPMPQPEMGGMPYSMHSKKVVVHLHGVGVALRARRRLLGETLRLVERVDELGVGVDDFPAVDHELETVHHQRVGVVFARERRQVERMVRHENGIDKFAAAILFCTAGR